jgi:hypothetical protein
MLAAYATVQSCGIPIILLTGGAEVRIEGRPTTLEWVVLAIVAAAATVTTTRCFSTR